MNIEVHIIPVWIGRWILIEQKWDVSAITTVRDNGKPIRDANESSTQQHVWRPKSGSGAQGSGAAPALICFCSNAEEAKMFFWRLIRIRQ